MWRNGALHNLLYIDCKTCIQCNLINVKHRLVHFFQIGLNIQAFFNTFVKDRLPFHSLAHELESFLVEGPTEILVAVELMDHTKRAGELRIWSPPPSLVCRIPGLEQKAMFFTMKGVPKRAAVISLLTGHMSCGVDWKEPRNYL